MERNEPRARATWSAASSPHRRPRRRVPGRGGAPHRAGRGAAAVRARDRGAGLAAARDPAAGALLPAEGTEPRHVYLREATQLRARPGGARSEHRVQPPRRGHPAPTRRPRPTPTTASWSSWPRTRPLGPAAQEVQVAAAGALRDLNRYPDPDKSLLRRRIAERSDIAPGRVAVGNGSCEILLAAAEAMLEPGAEIVYAWPSFSMYPHLAAMTGARGVTVPLDDAGRHDLEAMAREVNHATRIVLVCNPNNPTATALPPDAIEAFVDELPRHVAVILDEAYVEFSLAPGPRRVARPACAATPTWCCCARSPRSTGCAACGRATRSAPSSFRAGGGPRAPAVLGQRPGPGRRGRGDPAPGRGRAARGAAPRWSACTWSPSSRSAASRPPRARPTSPGWRSARPRRGRDRARAGRAGRDRACRQRSRGRRAAAGDLRHPRRRTTASCPLSTSFSEETHDQDLDRAGADRPHAPCRHAAAGRSSARSTTSPTGLQGRP